MSLETQIASLDERIEALTAQRRQLRAQAAVRRDRHQSAADLEAKLQALTLAQLRAELSVERKRYRSLRRITGPGATVKLAASRTKARQIAERIREHA